ncbi:hypothetical protein [Actinoplanes sp. NBRC 101535]|nr:hypothetical protein [Actinoplanes sp. NBRC 101535]GLY02079.1 hypothetical protein Acsp01_24580 [Actinoplanes sp. NBRC 101535]
MGGLRSGIAPLRGRAGLEPVVPTLDYRLAATTDPRVEPVGLDRIYGR